MDDILKEFLKADVPESMCDETKKHVYTWIKSKINNDLCKLAERLTKEAANWEHKTGDFFVGYRVGIREAVIAINEYIRKSQ